MSEIPIAAHALDRAVALSPDPAGCDGDWLAHTQPEWWNMVGPFGGISAALMLQSALRHPQLQGSPVALTVHYAAAIREGPMLLQAHPVRTSRSTQHWTLQLSQFDADGAAQTVMVGTLMTARRPNGWRGNDVPMPRVPAPEDLVGTGAAPEQLTWLQHYDPRVVCGGLPPVWGTEASADDATDSLSLLWIRERPARALDYVALTARCDVFFPRIWLRRARQIPAGTVTLTVYFHAVSQQLQDCGDDFVLGQARGQGYGDGFFDQSAQIWSRSGVLLATSHQLVYYKEN